MRTIEDIRCDVDGVAVEVSTWHRPGRRPPVLMLHGFGSTKEDFADLARHPRFADRGLVAYDAPGCGASTIGDPAAVSVPFLVEVATRVVDLLGLQAFHLVGHSMGGLTALLLAERLPGRVLGFVDVEGNLAPEDCFLSRQVLTHPAGSDEEFLASFARRAAESTESSSALFAASVRHTVRPEVVRGIFSSMVELSDHGDLLERFLRLGMPRAFMVGEQNAHLGYLPRLAAEGVEVMQIAESGHWPMYANPVETWQRLAAFFDAVDAA